jgi:vanillate O-demethylase monooxygenase subunit
VGGSIVIGFFIVPFDDEDVRIYSSPWRNELDGSKERMDEALTFETAVVAEDLALKSRFEVLTLTLDVTEEVHTRAGKVAVEHRRVLSDLVSTARESAGQAA